MILATIKKTNNVQQVVLCILCFERRNSRAKTHGLSFSYYCRVQKHILYIFILFFGKNTFSVLFIIVSGADMEILYVKLFWENTDFSKLCFFVCSSIQGLKLPFSDRGETISMSRFKEIEILCDILRGDNLAGFMVH